ncbi:cell division protein FtsZ [Siminovitchia fordii]|uniref:Tubulin/FtsZ GTPase domain-containing protein n=1 Tax=Siminovitchia fordii TaxID=254759 RepID=A0ABQ4KA88_9BACI|nr:cell division protein FtsZ [Siminovitchia fordii]GIN22643.1 hypothetical protein J1TS3_37770 [Siminovitchia fordii]
MFACVGIGQAGNNIADEFVKAGFPSLAINFSKSDLSSLEHVKDKLNLVGSEGVGKQRSRAIGLMKNNWESTVEFIKKNFSQPSIEVILIVFSTAGGTGSGISPFISEILQEKMPDKTIVVCPILPDTSEFVGNQVNTQEALDQLSQLDICTIPIDNHSIANKNEKKLPKNLLYKEINNQFTSLFIKLSDYTGKSSKIGVLDKRDLRQLFSTKGIMIISETNLYDISNLNLESSHFIKKIQKSWNDNIFTPIQYDQLIRAGIIFDGNLKFMEYLRYDKLFKVFSHPPIELFEGYYDEGNGKLISILSGLNWIYERVKEIDFTIENQRKSLQNVNHSVYKSKHLNKQSLLESITANKNTEKPKSRSVTDILNKYAR